MGKRTWVTMLVSIWCTLAQAQTSDLANTARRIGVLVLAGDELTLKRIGFVVFGNVERKIDVPDMRLADLIFDEVKKELAAEERFDVRRIAIDRTSLATLATKVRDAKSAWRETKLDEFRSELRPYLRACDCDALLVVFEAERDEPNTNQRIRGLTWLLGGVDQGGRTRAPLLIQLLATPAGVVAQGGATSWGWARVALAESPKVDETRVLAPEQWDALVAAFRAELANSLRFGLYSTGLRASCTQYFYEYHTPPEQRIPGTDRFVWPPTAPDWADPKRCPPWRPGQAR